MVKGVSKRIVVVDAPDRRFFEQAIFIVRGDAAQAGIPTRDLVAEARRIARDYAGTRRRAGRWRGALGPILYLLTGAALVGLAWLLTELL